MDNTALKRGGMSFAAFVAAFAVIWLLLDNFALALIFALFAGGGAEAAQRASNKGE